MWFDPALCTCSRGCFNSAVEAIGNVLYLLLIAFMETELTWIVEIRVWGAVLFASHSCMILIRPVAVVLAAYSLCWTNVAVVGVIRTVFQAGACSAVHTADLTWYYSANLE